MSHNWCNLIHLRFLLLMSSASLELSSYTSLTLCVLFLLVDWQHLLNWLSFPQELQFAPQAGQKLRGNVVFTTMAIRIYFASLTLICKLLFIGRISWVTKMLILNSQMLAFLGTLFILAIKILKAKLQTFHSNVLMRESYEKCCNWLKSRNTP